MKIQRERLERFQLRDHGAWQGTRFDWENGNDPYGSSAPVTKPDMRLACQGIEKTAIRLHFTTCAVHQVCGFSECLSAAACHNRQVRQPLTTLLHKEN